MATIYRRHPLTAGRIIDGEAFVVTADDNKMHTLNGSGTLLWDLAKDGLTVDQGASELVEHYDVDLQTARKDVSECIQLFVDSGILIEDSEEAV